MYRNLAKTKHKQRDVYRKTHFSIHNVTKIKSNGNTKF